MNTHSTRATRRKLIPNLFNSMLTVIADADHPLTQQEIEDAVAQRLERNDEELRRQITVNLNDALINGYLSIQDYQYSMRLKLVDIQKIPEPREMGEVQQVNVGNQLILLNMEPGTSDNSARETLDRILTQQHVAYQLHTDEAQFANERESTEYNVVARRDDKNVLKDETAKKEADAISENTKSP